MNVLPGIRNQYPSLVGIALVCALASGCTTDNQQALGIGVNAGTQAAAQTPPPENATVPPAGGDQNTTRAALAPPESGSLPAASAASGLSEPALQPQAQPPLARVGFLPITGAPPRAVSSFSGHLNEAARPHNIQIAGSGGANSQYRLKGYMSALNEGASTTVTFYWDVLDGSGRRLYRINGFERISGARSDPWAGVTGDTMRRIANRTMSGLAAWLGRNRA